jgi:hypothetical protein
VLADQRNKDEGMAPKSPARILPAAGQDLHFKKKKLDLSYKAHVK